MFKIHGVFSVVVIATSLAFAVSIDDVKAQASRTNQVSSTGTVSNEPFGQLRIIDSLYYPGPGDVFSISIVGGMSSVLPVVVSADCILNIPGVGEIPLADRTYKAIKEEILIQCNQIFRNSKISVSLNHLRTFRVYISGDVLKPGSYLASGAMRCSDVLEKVASLNDLRFRRNIQFIRDGRVVKTCDLAAFYNAGLINGNEYLSDNSVINVPTRAKTVTITGAVNMGGVYDFIEGDRIVDLLSAAGGLSEGSDSSRIFISRFQENNHGIDTFTISLINSAGTPVHYGDRIVCLPLRDFRKKYDVIIDGEIAYPGVYAIRKDSTWVSDVIELAGGLTRDAFLQSSYIIRPRDSLVNQEISRDPERFLKLIRSVPVDPASIWPEEMSYQKAVLIDNGDKIAINIESALENRHSSNDMILKSGDMIVIARRSANIQIWGAVVSPGLIPYYEGLSVSEYIKRAGGFNRIAETGNVLIRHSGTRTWIRAHNQMVKQGDAILVPEQKYRDSYVFTKDMVGFIASALGIIASSLSIGLMIQSIK